MASDQSFVIVGANLAGAKDAEALRTKGFDGQVILIDEEAQHPYHRRLLSKDYLRDHETTAKFYVHDEHLRRTPHRADDQRPRPVH